MRLHGILGLVSLLRLVEVSCAAAALFGATALAGLSGCTAEDPGYVPSDAGTRDGAAMDGSRADGGGVDGGPFDAGDVDGASSMDAGGGDAQDRGDQALRHRLPASSPPRGHGELTIRARRVMEKPLNIETNSVAAGVRDV